MIDQLCGPCQDDGRMVKAHYQTNPPTCREHYLKRPGAAPSKTIAELFAEHRQKHQSEIQKQAIAHLVGFCLPCAQSGERTPASHRMNGMEMCREHANAAAVVDGPPEAIEAEDVEVKAEKSKEEKTMGMGKGIDAETIAEIRKLAATGMSAQKISEETGVSWPTAKRYMEGNTPANGTKPKAAKPPKKAQIVAGALGPYVAANALMRRWNQEADAAFAALPLEKKAELLASLE